MRSCSKPWAVPFLILLGACAPKEVLPEPDDPRTCASAEKPAAREVESRRIVSVRPGESVCFPLREQDRLAALQMSADGSGTTLRVYNPTSDVLTFTALVYLEEGEGGYPSTTCPVGAGLTGSEHWPERAVRIAVSNFTLHAPAKAPSECQ